MEDGITSLYSFSQGSGLGDKHGIKADNMSLESTTDTDGSEATFKGKAFNIGTGVIFKINSKLVIDASYIYSKMYIDRMNGLGKVRKPKDTFIGDEETFNLGISYLF